MAVRADVTPNRRGVKSRELVLDAAERVMAEHGFEAATVARVVQAAGIPLSSVYHYYGSKDGILLAVMERGAERFFADLPEWDRRIGDPADHLAAIISPVAQALERHPDFLRLLVVFAAQPPAVTGGEIQAVVTRVRRLGLERLQEQLAIAFDDDQTAPRSSGSRGSRSPLSTARSSPLKPTPQPRSPTCSSRSQPHSSPHTAPPDQSSRRPWRPPSAARPVDPRSAASGRSFLNQARARGHNAPPLSREPRAPDAISTAARQARTSLIDTIRLDLSVIPGLGYASSEGEERPATHRYPATRSPHDRRGRACARCRASAFAAPALRRRADPRPRAVPARRQPHPLRPTGRPVARLRDRTRPRRFRPPAWRPPPLRDPNLAQPALRARDGSRHPRELRGAVRGRARQ